MPTNFTPNRAIRVSDELWGESKRVANERGETVSAVVVRGLDLYVRSNGYGVDPITALERLAGLHKAGAITDAEWAMKRRELLDRI